MNSRDCEAMGVFCRDQHDWKPRKRLILSKIADFCKKNLQMYIFFCNFACAFWCVRRYQKSDIRSQKYLTLKI